MHIQHRGISSHKPAMTSPTVVSSFLCVFADTMRDTLFLNVIGLKSQGDYIKNNYYPEYLYVDVITWYGKIPAHSAFPTPPTPPTPAPHMRGADFSTRRGAGGVKGLFFC